MRKIASENIDMDRIPKHIAIIMDGNGRWAKQQGMPRTMGHRAGVEALRNIVRFSSNLGVKYLTVYAFSTENWRRPQSEIGILMSLLKEYVRKELDELNANNVKIRILGDIYQLPKDVLESILFACQKTKDNTGLIFNLALNYGGRAELIMAIKKIINDVQNNYLETEEINENLFDSYLYTAGCPEPELLIRTSGEMRLSNFLLWQVAYSEIVVVKECWPDFNEKSLHDAIRTYQNRERRFGGIKKVEE
jgi:undecaprenyl diphosphate synthase